MNKVITASRMASLHKCARQHYWAYEVGLRKNSAAAPLRFGSAWARALEAVYRGADYDGALAAAIPEGVDLDPVQCATVAGLLAGYLARWHGEPTLRGFTLRPEMQFSQELWDGWTADGKIDLLATRYTTQSSLPSRNIKRVCRAVLVESKTTSASVDAGSDFWLRLAFNVQVLQYVEWLERQGYTVDKVIYDVTKKPSIRPKQVYDLDEQGRKIVLDAQGNRVLNAKGEPRQTADEAKGWTVQCHLETPDEYAERLRLDTLARPDFYFARKEVAILEQDLLMLQHHRGEAIALIEHYRSREEPSWGPQAAWLRNVNEMTCRSCQYKDFCLTNITIDTAHPPEGFSIQPFNPELEQHTDDSAEQVEG